MDEEAETKAIEKWLRMVDKPLATDEDYEWLPHYSWRDRAELDKINSEWKIPCETITCNSDELKKDILPLLRDRVFHITPQKGFDGIMKDGVIKRSGEIPSKWKKSYGWKMGYVCLFNLRNVSDEKIDKALYQYDFLNPESALYNPFFLILSERAYPQLELSEQKPFRAGTWIQYVECWYPTDLPLDKITKIVEVRVKIKIFKNPKTSAQLLAMATYEDEERKHRVKAGRL